MNTEDEDQTPSLSIPATPKGAKEGQAEVRNFPSEYGGAPNVSPESLSADVALDAAADTTETIEDRPSPINGADEHTHVPLFDRLMRPTVAKESQDTDAADVQAKTETIGVEPSLSYLNPADDLRLSGESTDITLEVPGETIGADSNVPGNDLPAETEVVLLTTSARSIPIEALSQASVPVPAAVRGPMTQIAGIPSVASTLLTQATVLREAYITANQAVNHARRVRELSQARYEIEKWNVMASTRLAAVHPPLRLLLIRRPAAQ